MLEINFYINWYCWLFGFERVVSRDFEGLDIYFGPFSWRVTYE